MKKWGNTDNSDLGKRNKIQQSLGPCISDGSSAALFETEMYNSKKTKKQVVLYIWFSRLVTEKSERNDTVGQMTIYSYPRFATLAEAFQEKFSAR